MVASCWILSLVSSIPRLILAPSNHEIERGLKPSFDDTINNVTKFRESNLRVLNAYTKHSVRAQSLTQELYGIIDFPEGTTTATFQKIFDEYVESYFSLNVDPTLIVDSKVTVTNVLAPSNANRYLRRQQRNLQDIEGKHEGASVIITYDQQLSYNFPIDGGMLALETLVTLPFLTDIGRNEFYSKLKDSDDIILQEVIAVSKVDIPPQSPTTQPINLPTQLPREPVSEPQSPITQPIKSPTQLTTRSPTKLPTAFPSKRPSPAPLQPPDSNVIKPTLVQTKSPGPPPSKSQVPSPPNPPVVVPTARPTGTKANPLKNDADSEGISGLIIIGCLMAVLFIAFAINMKYCMGEYVD